MFYECPLYIGDFMVYNKADSKIRHFLDTYQAFLKLRIKFRRKLYPEFQEQRVSHLSAGK